MGHKRTIRPNAKRLSPLFGARDRMEWSTFSRKVKSCQRGFMGEPEEMRPGRGDFHEFPSACICQKPPKYLALNKNESLNISVDESTDEYIGNERHRKRSLKRKKPY